MLISFEGLDCSGKTTVIGKIKKYLEEEGLIDHFVFTKEPYDNTKESRMIKEIILNHMYDTHIQTENILFLALRNINIKNIIEPALKNNKIVICDRYVDSSIAYQGAGRELGMTSQSLMNTMLFDVYPYITFYIDISPEESFKRINEQTIFIDKIEQNGLDFIKRVHKGYDTIIKSNKRQYKVINGEQDETDVYNSVLEHIKLLIEKEGLKSND